MSDTSVKTYINHIFAKLGAYDRAHAAMLAHRFGFVM